ncbi:response regulator transcription factor [Sphingopyxis fribergensis]
MKNMASPNPPAGEFDFLTAKQKAVLELLANHRTSKEIAHALGVSETSVNRRIEGLKQRLGGITRQELARRYALWIDANGAAAAAHSAQTPASLASGRVNSAPQILPLAENPSDADNRQRDGELAATTFEDPVAMSIEAPWKEWREPRIVPRVLDGDNATLTRGAAIALLLAAIVASLVLGLAAAQALADAVS